MSTLLIDLENVHITRQGTPILQGVDLVMHAHQHLAVIGPNGAGKSFLLRVLSADLVPSRGRVTLLGKTFGRTSLWDLRKQIGFVSSRMLFWYEAKNTVLDIVCSGFLGTYGLPEPPTSNQTERALKMLDFFSIEPLKERPFEILSDGERRKVLLARALVNDPHLLIFDEPCQGLDLPSRDLFLDDVDELAVHIPLVYVTHHLEELPTCITDVLYLKQGRIAHQGPKAESLTSGHLSEAFDHPLEVVQKGSRFYVHHVP